MNHNIRRSGRWFAPLIACTFVAGCSYTYQPTGPNAGTGVLTFDTPAALPPLPPGAPMLGDDAPPAPDFMAAAFPTPSLTPPAPGLYRGTGSVMRDVGGMCSAMVAITNWTVTYNNQVQFGAFSGPIQPNGAL